MCLPNTEQISLENLRLEYSEVNNNRRHYSNLRFAGLSVFFAVLGGIASVAFGIVDVKRAPFNITIAARIAGLIFTWVFFSFEILCDLNVRYFGRVARILEYQLGYCQFRGRRFRFPRAYCFTWGMYIILLGFWLYLIGRFLWTRT